MTLLGYVLLLTAAVYCAAAPDSSCKAPKILNGFLKTRKDSFDLGSYAEFECNKDYVKNMPTGPKCEKGQWSDDPVCYSPCKVSSEALTSSNVQLDLPDTAKTYVHGTELEVSCNPGYRRPNQQTFFIECYNGKFIYQRCFSGKPCRMDQEELDGNNLELDEVHNNEVYYQAGETITFKCKNGYSHHDRQPTGRCLKEEITYPTCTIGIGEQCGPPPTVQFGDTIDVRKISYKSGEKVEYKCPNFYTLKGDRIVMCLNGVWGEAPACLEPCTPKKRNMVENNIQLKWRESEKLYSVHGDIMEFTCKPGYDPLPDTNMRTACDNGKLDYPKCFRNEPCTAPPLLHGKYTPRKREFSNGEYLQYECNKGYMTEKRNLLATAQCLNGELSEIPKCIAITCEHESSLYKDEAVITYSCPHGKRPKSDLVQCFNYGWGPPVICQEEKPGQPDATNPPPDDIESEELSV